MLVAITWSDVTVAGAFIGGAILGAAGTIRVTRWVLEYARRDQRRELSPPADRTDPRPRGAWTMSDPTSTPDAEPELEPDTEPDTAPDLEPSRLPDADTVVVAEQPETVNIGRPDASDDQDDEASDD